MVQNRNKISEESVGVIPSPVLYTSNGSSLLTCSH